MTQKKTITHDAIKIIEQKKRDLTIFIIFTLVILIVLIAFAIRPMAVKIAEINNQIKTKDNIHMQLDSKINNLISLRNQYEDLEDDLEDLPLILPNNWDFSLFVANVEEFVEKNDFELLSVSLGDSEEDEEEFSDLQKIKSWSVSIVIKGKQENLLGLFEDLENLPMYCTISALSYEIDLEEMATDGTNEYNIGATLYYLDDPIFYNIFDF